MAAFFAGYFLGLAMLFAFFQKPDRVAVAVPPRAPASASVSENPVSPKKILMPVSKPASLAELSWILRARERRLETLVGRIDDWSYSEDLGERTRVQFKRMFARSHFYVADFEFENAGSRIQVHLVLDVRYCVDSIKKNPKITCPYSAYGSLSVDGRKTECTFEEVFQELNFVDGHFWANAYPYRNHDGGDSPVLGFTVSAPETADSVSIAKFFFEETGDWVEVLVPWKIPSAPELATEEALADQQRGNSSLAAALPSPDELPAGTDLLTVPLRTLWSLVTARSRTAIERLDQSLFETSPRLPQHLPEGDGEMAEAGLASPYWVANFQYDFGDGPVKVSLVLDLSCARDVALKPLKDLVEMSFCMAQVQSHFDVLGKISAFYSGAYSSSFVRDGRSFSAIQFIGATSDSRLGIRAYVQLPSRTQSDGQLMIFRDEDSSKPSTSSFEWIPLDQDRFDARRKTWEDEGELHWDQERLDREQILKPKER